jgi:hypothetical protein
VRNVINKIKIYERYKQKQGLTFKLIGTLR